MDDSKMPRVMAASVLLSLALSSYGASVTYLHPSDDLTISSLGQVLVVSFQGILRAIQLYNAGSYHADDSTEDGFAPGPSGGCNCSISK